MKITAASKRGLSNTETEVAISLIKKIKNKNKTDLRFTWQQNTIIFRESKLWQQNSYLGEEAVTWMVIALYRPRPFKELTCVKYKLHSLSQFSIFHFLSEFIFFSLKLLWNIQSIYSSIDLSVCPSARESRIAWGGAKHSDGSEQAGDSGAPVRQLLGRSEDLHEQQETRAASAQRGGHHYLHHHRLARSESAPECGYHFL